MADEKVPVKRKTLEKIQKILYTELRAQVAVGKVHSIVQGILANAKQEGKG